MTRQDPPTVILDQSRQSTNIDRRAFVNAFVEDLIGTEVVDRADRIRSMIAMGRQKLAVKPTVEEKQIERQRQEIEAQMAKLQRQLAELGAE